MPGSMAGMYIPAPKLIDMSVDWMRDLIQFANKLKNPTQKCYQHKNPQPTELKRSCAPSGPPRQAVYRRQLRRHLVHLRRRARLAAAPVTLQHDALLGFLLAIPLRPAALSDCQYDARVEDDQQRERDYACGIEHSISDQ